jgi:succinyl-diaminopimelate desuccinylase
MTVHAIDPIALARDLIRCPSVTPAEGGALTLLQSLLEPAGFTCHRLVFSEPGTADVDNLFARIGFGAPHLCFAGHTDVVPTGDPAAWKYPPFEGMIAKDHLWGRGAVDMKGNIAAFVAAMTDFLGDPARLGQGSISLLITGDEEAVAVNGTVKVLKWMAGRGHTPDHCLVGEPSNPDALGDAIKIGRRGSLSVAMTVLGRQGHAAYPALADNPLPGLVRIADALTRLKLDDGTPNFAPSNLEVVSIDTGNPAFNVIPRQATLRLNVRYNDRHDSRSMEALLRRTAEQALGSETLKLEMRFEGNADAFLTDPRGERGARLLNAMRGASETVTGRTPELSTSGGTSDARFVKDYCPVIEFGLVNRTIHAVDERVSLADLEGLTRIYRDFLGRYFAPAV